jgi:hypothetical protein
MTNNPGSEFFFDKETVSYADVFNLNILPNPDWQNSNISENKKEKLKKKKKIRTLNFPMFSYWFHVKNKFEDILYSDVFCEQFGRLFDNDYLLKFIRVQMLFEYQSLDDFNEAKKLILDGLGLDENTKFKLWSDSLMGINNFHGLKTWMEMVQLKKQEKVKIFYKI